MHGLSHRSHITGSLTLDIARLSLQTLYHQTAKFWTHPTSTGMVVAQLQLCLQVQNLEGLATLLRQTLHIPRGQGGLYQGTPSRGTPSKGLWQ